MSMTPWSWWRVRNPLPGPAAVRGVVPRRVIYTRPVPVAPWDPASWLAEAARNADPGSVFVECVREFEGREVTR